MHECCLAMCHADEEGAPPPLAARHLLPPVSLWLEPEFHHGPCHQRQRTIEIPIQNHEGTLRQKLLLNCEFIHVNKFTKL